MKPSEDTILKPWEWTKESLIMYIRTDPVVLYANMEYADFLRTFTQQRELFRRSKRKDCIKELDRKKQQMDMIVSKAQLEVAKRCLGGHTHLKDAIRAAKEAGEDIPEHVRLEHPDIFPS